MDSELAVVFFHNNEDDGPVMLTIDAVRVSAVNKTAHISALVCGEFSVSLIYSSALRLAILSLSVICLQRKRSVRPTMRLPSLFLL